MFTSIIANLEKRFEETQTGAFVIVKDKQIIGTVDLQLVDKDNNIGGFGYWIDEDYQGLGITTISLKRLIDYAFTLNLHKLTISCVKENIHSNKVAIRVGFEHEASLKSEFLLHGKYHDLERYSLFKS